MEMREKRMGTVLEEQRRHLVVADNIQMLAQMEQRGLRVDKHLMKLALMQHQDSRAHYWWHYLYLTSH
jgi:hypothetical protein